MYKNTSVKVYVITRLVFLFSILPIIFISSLPTFLYWVCGILFSLSIIFYILEAQQSGNYNFVLIWLLVPIFPAIISAEIFEDNVLKVVISVFPFLVIFFVYNLRTRKERNFIKRIFQHYILSSNKKKKNDLSAEDLLGRVKTVKETYGAKPNSNLRSNNGIKTFTSITNYNHSGNRLKYFLYNSKIMEDYFNEIPIYSIGTKMRSGYYENYTLLELIEYREYSIDRKRNSSVECKYNSMGDLVSKSYFGYDKLGNINKVSVYDSKKELIQDYTYDYDKSKRLIKNINYISSTSVLNEHIQDAINNNQINGVENDILFDDMRVLLSFKELQHERYNVEYDNAFNWVYILDKQNNRGNVESYESFAREIDYYS